MAGKKENKLLTSKRYASALLSIAAESGKQGKIKEDLENFSALLNFSEELRRAIRSKIIARSELAAAITEILEKNKADEVTKKFAEVVVTNGRAVLFQNIISAYKDLYLELEGEVTAVVTSAIPLTQSHVQAISSTLKKVSDMKINIEEKIDQKILGGVVIRLGSKMIDNSVAGKLEKLKLLQKKTLVG